MAQRSPFFKMSGVWHTDARQYSHVQKLEKSGGLSVIPLLFAFIAAMAVSGRDSLPVVLERAHEPVDFDDIDFDRYQRGLISLNRRLDAIEATLGGLAALEIVATTYMLEKVGGSRDWTAGILGPMLAAIAVALIGIFAFGGDETPNLVEFNEERRADRKRAIQGAIGSMTETYKFNERQVSRKVSLRLVSVWITGIVGAIFALHVVELIK